MAAKKKSKKPLAKKAMKKTKGGAQVDYFLKLKGIDGEATDTRPVGSTISYVGLE